MNTQKSAEVVVVERQRTESVGVSNITEKGVMTSPGRKLRTLDVCKEIVRNIKGMQKRSGHSILYGKNETVHRRSSWK